MNHSSHVCIAVNEEEQFDEAGDSREPGASGLPGDESLPKVEGVPNPEKLAGNKHYEDDAEGHPRGSELAEIDERVDTRSKNQRESDDALVRYDALINCGETDHPRATRARQSTTNRELRPRSPLGGSARNLCCWWWRANVKRKPLFHRASKSSWTVQMWSVSPACIAGVTRRV